MDFSTALRERYGVTVFLELTVLEKRWSRGKTEKIRNEKLHNLCYSLSRCTALTFHELRLLACL